MKTTEKLYYTVDDIRHQIYSDQISKTTLLTLIKDKKIPTIRMRRRYLIPKWWVQTQINLALNNDVKEERK